MQPLCSLNDRVVLVTGAAGYFGQAITRGLCEAGATVVLAGRSAESLSAQVRPLVKRGLVAEACPMDVTIKAQRRDALRTIADRHGRLDVLVNNAYAEPNATGEAAFAASYDVAVTSGWGLISEAMEMLVAAGIRNTGGASVINIASMYGLVSPDFRVYGGKMEPNPPHYGAAKAALLQLTRYLACELGPRRIRVNAISPGPFPSPEVLSAYAEFGERLAARNPLGRIGQPQEMIGPVVFLASDAASYVTGANLSVDGGWTAW